MNQHPILLLDFAKQLRRHTFNLPREEEARIRGEEYNAALIELLAAHEGPVILLSTRQGRWAPLTLATIKAKTGWEPDESYWNDHTQEPAEMKSRILQHYIIPRHGEPTPGLYVAIEDDPRSVAMYEGHGIPSTTICGRDFVRLLTGGPKRGKKG